VGVDYRSGREVDEVGDALDGSWAPWSRVRKKTMAARVLGSPGSLKEAEQSVCSSLITPSILHLFI
jgi:hypothetical protein